MGAVFGSPREFRTVIDRVSTRVLAMLNIAGFGMLTDRFGVTWILQVAAGNL